MTRNPERPLSPHLTIWKWGPHMLVSILHRVTGTGVAVVGGAILVWWLMAAAEGGDSYATFIGWADWRTFPWSLVIWIPLTWAVFQHTLSGVRHLVMDLGAGYELPTNKLWANMTILGSTLLTVALWAWIIWGRGA